MQLESSVAPLFFPDPEQNSVLHLGFAPLPMSQWIKLDTDFAIFQQHKLAQQTNLQRVFQSLPESEAAQADFAQFLARHLLAQHSDTFQVNNNDLLHKPSGRSWPLATNCLWQASLWAQEDFCLLEKKPDGLTSDYVLTAASVCSPSNWFLEDKIGKGLNQIHKPVPGYKQQLAARVNRFMESLRADRAYQRYNWSLQKGNQLLWRADEINDGGSGCENESESETKVASRNNSNIYWRVERQTFVKLPQSGAVVFAIRIYLHSAKRMNQLMNFDDAIAKLVARLPQDERRYKDLDHFVNSGIGR